MKNRLVRTELGIDVKAGRLEQGCQRYGVEEILCGRLQSRQGQ